MVFTPRQNEGYCYHNNCTLPRGCVVPTTTLVEKCDYEFDDIMKHGMLIKILPLRRIPTDDAIQIIHTLCCLSRVTARDLLLL